MPPFIFDPILGWRRSLGQITERNQQLEHTLQIGRNGYRQLPNQAAKGERTVAFFGCSVTEGYWLDVEETFAFLLQRRFPNWRIDPRGVGGYSTVQNLLQLESYLVTERPNVVVFGYIPVHLFRNVADPFLWPPVANHTENQKGPVGPQRFDRFRPSVTLNLDGSLSYIRRHPPKSEEALEAMMRYRPDPMHRLALTQEVVKQAKKISEEAGATFIFTVLRSQASLEAMGQAQENHLADDPLISRLRSAGVQIVDADPRMPFDESTFQPIDLHPNATANAYFATALGDALAQL